MAEPGFTFPNLPNDAHTPVWTGRGFRVGQQEVPVLSYEAGPSGWTDQLTAFHEDTAGDSHFIDLASRREAVSQLARYLPGANAVILDIGCSSGFLLTDLRAAFPAAQVMGADVILGPLLHLAETQPEIPLLHFDLTCCPLPDSCVDAVVLLNVLEHIEDDSLAVRQVFRILKPGGIAVIEVPAGPELYDIYDELLMHYRRYRSAELQRLIRGAGFAVLRQSHLGFLLYPGFFLVKFARRRKRASIGDDEIPALIGRNINRTGGDPLLRLAMNLELAIGKNISYPFGIRCLITGRKPR